MTVTSLYTYSQVLAAGYPFWRLQITNWGNRGAGADSDSIDYTGSIEAGAAAVMIGPDSTVDEINLAYYSTLIGPAVSILNPGSLNQLEFTVGVKRPVFNIPGPLAVGTSFSTMFTDTYFKDGDPAAQNFGTAEPLFEAPELQLLFYPTVPPLPPVPKRNDMYRSRQTAGGAGTSETLIGIWPVMGRSCKSLYFRATGDLVANIRVGGIIDVVSTSVGVPVSRAVEDTIGTAAISGVTGVQESITTGRPMQWISAYFTRVSGTGFINSVLFAEDC